MKIFVGVLVQRVLLRYSYLYRSCFYCASASSLLQSCSLIKVADNLSSVLDVAKEVNVCYVCMIHSSIA